MKVSKITQISKNQILEEEYDIFITSSGYEERSTFISKLGIKAKKKVVFGFCENRENSKRKNNDKFYIQNNFEFIASCGSNDEEIVSYIKSALEEDIFCISIAIDYSSMTRIWYSSIINFLNNYQEERIVNLFFLYTKALFSPPPKTENHNYFFEPIKGFSNLSIPNKPTALLLGLGYEKRRAFSLKEYFDAEEVYVFITDENSAPDFHREVCSRNQELISKTSTNYIFKYPVDDLLYTKKIIYDLCKSLLKDFRIVIAPCGPKPFTLISLLIASQLPNIDVWRISGNKGYDKVNRASSSEILCLSVEYSQ